MVLWYSYGNRMVLNTQHSLNVNIMYFCDKNYIATVIPKWSILSIDVPSKESDRLYMYNGLHR